MRDWLPKVLLMALVPVYAVYLLAPAFGYMHDDGIYLLTAQSLAQKGSYTILSLPAEPAQSKYPVLYPAMLSLFWRLSDNIQTVALLGKLFSFVCFSVWVWLMRREAVRMFGVERWADWFVVLLVAANWCVFLATGDLPDMPFALLTWLAILTVRRFVAAPERWGLVVMAGVMAGGVLLMRTTGLALVAACALAFLRVRWVAAVGYVASAGVVVAPWVLWQMRQAVPTDVVQLYYSRGSYALGNILGGYSLEQILDVVGTNLLILTLSVFSPVENLPPMLGLIPGAVVLAVMAFGWYKRLRADWGVEAIWVGLYVGLLLSWLWPPQRYIVPAIPLLLLFGIEGIRQVSWSERTRRAFPAMLVACGVMAVGLSYVGAFHTWRNGTPAVGMVDSDRWENTTAIAAWVRANTEPGDVIASNLDPVLYALTGRKGIRLFEHLQYQLFYEDREVAHPVGTAEGLRRNIESNQIRFLVVTEMQGFAEGLAFPSVLADFQKRWPGVLRERAYFGDTRNTIYEVVRQQLHGNDAMHSQLSR
jgi:hypothetical protein